jgi:hypothetical protein
MTYGSRYFTLAVRRSSSDHSAAGDVFAPLSTDMATNFADRMPDRLTAPIVAQSASAVSWPAILAGAFVASAVTLILLALGSGIGFASISPWPNAGVSGMTFAVVSAIWLILTQWISAAFGGYIAGRLRTRWIGTHTHEVFFRDTAHGLITWAVASVLMAVTLSSTAFSSLGALAAKSNAMAAGPGASYEVDRLLRPSDAVAATSAPDATAEVTHILAGGIAKGRASAADRDYLIQLVARRAGVSQQDAQQRVDEFLAAADAARKGAAEAATFLALALLVGAFIASISAALGGRLRDEHP